MNVLGNKLGDMEDRRPGNFPIFDPTAPLLVFSDYSGSHGGSKFDTYSFLFIQQEEVEKWEMGRAIVRREYRFEKGRMEYKKLKNSDRARACYPWLVAAGELEGLLITFSIQRSLGKFFDHAQLEMLKSSRPDLNRASGKTIERMFRICHFLALILAGLASTKQEVIWITDQDDIAADEEMQKALKQTLQNVVQMYLGAPLETLHCATTAADNGSMQLEDLASIPDLIAGAIAEAHTQQVTHSHLPAGHTYVALPDTLPEKAKQILTWTSIPDSRLHRMVLAMYPAPDPNQVFWNRMVFGSEPLESLP